MIIFYFKAKGLLLPVSDKVKSRRLHKKHAVVTSNLGKHLNMKSICIVFKNSVTYSRDSTFTSETGEKQKGGGAETSPLTRCFTYRTLHQILSQVTKLRLIRWAIKGC